MRLFAGTEFDIPPTCDRCGLTEENCQCPPLPLPAPQWLDPETQTARIGTQKRKKGKLVTVVSGLGPADNDLATLLKRLKNECGAGGTIGDAGIEIQGDHVDRIAKTLRQIGFRIAR